MTFRSRLLLALAPLGVSLLAMAFLSGSVVVRLGESSSHILADNYRSVLAAQRMKEALERIDSGALFAALGKGDRGRALIADHRRAFEAELAVAEGNITEEGEAELVRGLGARWGDYRQTLDAFLAQPVIDAGRYFDALEPRFAEVRAGADQLLALNQDAMSRKSDRARKSAERFVRGIIVAAAVLCAFGLWASTALTRRFLRPLSVVSQAVRRFGEGDVQARARLEGQDELAKLASDFNDMADHLERYRKSSLGELLLAQQASQAAIDALPDPVVVFGVHGELLSANAAAGTLLRVSLDAPGSPLAAVEPEVRAAFDRLRAHVFAGKGAYVPKGFDEALRHPGPDGDRYLSPRAAPVYGEEGQVAGAAVVLSDVTRLRRADELKNDLVAFVAHEFRTPLTSLQMAVHLCAEEMAGPVTEKQADLLFAAREDCERLQAIVNDLLDVSRVHEGRIELALAAVDCEQLTAPVVAGHAESASDKGIALTSEVLPGTGLVLADTERVRLVFDNLVGNALRYTPRGGGVVLRARVVEDQVRFEVADTGPGIPKEQQALVFEKFYRLPGTQPQGAGLGLFIAREIVRAHQGAVGVDSEPGKGATIWFTLPLVAPPRP